MAVEGMHRVPDCGKLAQSAMRLFVVSRSVVLMRWLRETDVHVSPARMAYVLPWHAAGVLVLPRLFVVFDVVVVAAVATHCSVVARGVTWMLVPHDPVRLEKPRATSVLETSGISSCVLIMEIAHELHIRPCAGAAVLNWLLGSIPASFPSTELHRLPDLRLSGL